MLRRDVLQRAAICCMGMIALLMASVSPVTGVSEAEGVNTVSPQASKGDKQPPDNERVTVDKAHSPRSRVAVIIDDFGNGMRGTDEMFKLPVKLTVAVMPFLSTTKEDAIRAHKRGDDVLLHLPMEPRHGKPEWLGPGAVLSQMSDDEVRKRVEAALDDVPYAIGINNHMGSKVTSDERVMDIVLSVCKERGLFFVDSKTSYRSVVGKLSAQKGLPRVENQVFLDDNHTAGHVLKQMHLVHEKAMKSRYCITIGHVGIQGKETAAGIRGGINEMKDSVEFVGISDLLKEELKWKADPTLP
ncbi:divergent polysaccharide deacetylase family protein [Paenibacillus sp. sgz500958]|uniref:divergent polysaccharide deacetylase family protein n=1 Tax=Paenibacillus sp. sgz500958 TaxID=3242475 RepID=UPI0036D2E782